MGGRLQAREREDKDKTKLRDTLAMRDFMLDLHQMVSRWDHGGTDIEAGATMELGSASLHGLDVLKNAAEDGSLLLTDSLVHSYSTLSQLQPHHSHSLPHSHSHAHGVVADDVESLRCSQGQIYEQVHGNRSRTRTNSSNSTTSSSSNNSHAIGKNITHSDGKRHKHFNIHINSSSSSSKNNNTNNNIDRSGFSGINHDKDVVDIADDDDDDDDGEGEGSGEEGGVGGRDSDRSRSKRHRDSMLGGVFRYSKTTRQPSQPSAAVPCSVDYFTINPLVTESCLENVAVNESESDTDVAGGCGGGDKPHHFSFPIILPPLPPPPPSQLVRSDQPHEALIHFDPEEDVEGSITSLVQSPFPLLAVSVSMPMSVSSSLSSGGTVASTTDSDGDVGGSGFGYGDVMSESMGQNNATSVETSSPLVSLSPALATVTSVSSAGVGTGVGVGAVRVAEDSFLIDAVADNSDEEEMECSI